MNVKDLEEANKGIKSTWKVAMKAKKNKIKTEAKTGSQSTDKNKSTWQTNYRKEKRCH